MKNRRRNLFQCLAINSRLCRDGTCVGTFNPIKLVYDPRVHYSSLFLGFLFHQMSASRRRRKKHRYRTNYPLFRLSRYTHAYQSRWDLHGLLRVYKSHHRLSGTAFRMRRTFSKTSYITELTCRGIIEPNNARDVRSIAQQTSPDQTKLYIIKTIFLLILYRWEIFLDFPSKKEIQLRRKRSTLCSGCGRCDGNGDKLARMRNGWLLIVKALFICEPWISFAPYIHGACLRNISCSLCFNSFRHPSLLSKKKFR